jgi:hypothetical protein
LTKLNNNGGNNKWQNSGKFNTNTFEITGGCGEATAFNNCHMTVTGQFFMNHGNFVLDSGAAVECGSFKWVSDNYFHMGGKALLKVTGQLLADNWNTGYGFYGDGTDYAVIQAGSIAKENEGKFRAAYFGNLFIDTNNHFTQGEASADGTYYYFDESVKFSFTDNTDISGLTSSVKRKAQKATGFSIDITADAEGCTPGYHWGDNTPTATIRIIAEDLSATEDTDFDFNDVVFDVEFTSETSAKITLQAAGGTLPLTVAGEEVHAKFGITDTKTMINTNADRILTDELKAQGYKAVNNVAPVSFDVDGIQKSNWGKDIAIKVQKDGTWYDIDATTGGPAAKICVKPTFKWANEKQSIKARYQQFTEWVRDPSVDWY